MGQAAHDDSTSREKLAADIMLAASILMRDGDWVVPALDRLDAEMRLMDHLRPASACGT